MLFVLHILFVWYRQKANRFDPDVVLNQLRYSGMLETVKIRRAGFPVRRTFKDFYSRSVNPLQSVTCCCCVLLNLFEHVYRYKIILKNKIHSDDEKQCCSDLLTLQDKAKQEWHLGKTKVEHARSLSYMHTCPNLFVSLGSRLHSCHRNHTYVCLCRCINRITP